MAKRRVQRANSASRTNDTSRQSQSDEWKRWRESGKNVLDTARTLHDNRCYNYACFVGQESLELYVKSFLLKYNQAADPTKIRHDPYTYVIEKLTKQIKQTKQSNSRQIDMSGVQKVMESIRSIFDELRKGGINQTLWKKHVSSPRSASNNRILDSKILDKIKSDKPTYGLMKSIRLQHTELDFVVPVLNEPDMTKSIEQLKTHLREYIKPLAASVSKNPAKAFEKSKRSIMEHISFFFVVRWHATIGIAQSHQQFARYPENLGNVKYVATNAAYTKEISQDLLDRVSNAIKEIEIALDTSLEPDF